MRERGVAREESGRGEGALRMEHARKGKGGRMKGEEEEEKQWHFLRD